ncbi:MAG TPA: hypothetical protein VFB45_01255 [Pseudolabrys sp.]|nr:hypothetical protein [Pseudolabrys sp.]
MGVIKLFAAPIRSVVRFPLFQLLVVIAIILFLQAADDASVPGRIFAGLDKLTDASVQFVSALITVKSFTRSWLVTGFMIAYVYLACLLILFLLRLAFGFATDVVGRHNILWLRRSIARERGIVAYRAWEPFERIRPEHIPQQEWEETYAWPADNRPPYLPLSQRILRATIIYVVVIVVVVAALQLFTPFPVATWLGDIGKKLIGQ